MMLAIATDRDVRHGLIELLLTMAEDDGLVGAIGVTPDLLIGRLLVNVDSETFGEITIGSAGGRDTVLSLADVIKL
jgi:dipeptidase D